MPLKHIIQFTFFCLCHYSVSAHALSLSETLELATTNDATFQIAYADYIAATERQPQSRAALLPNIDFNAYASKTSAEITNSSSFGNGPSDYNSDGYSLTLSQTLYNKKLFDALDQSEAEVSQALASYQAAKLDLIIRTTTGYFKVLAANDNLVFALSEKEAIGQQLEQSTVRFNAGIIAITDVKESQAQFDISVSDEIAAENELANTREELNLIINTPFTKLNPLDQSIPLLEPDPQAMEQWQEAANNNNLDLRAAFYSVAAATEAASGSQADHYPTLNLNASHSSDSSDGSSLGPSFGGSDRDDTRISLNLAIPLYRGGLTSAKHRETIANLNRAKAVLTNQKRLTNQQTRNAYRGVNAAIAQSRALEKALESTQSAAEATLAGFEVGTRNSVDVLFAQREQNRSERDYSRALYDYILNILILKQSAGSLSEEDVLKVNQWLSKPGNV